jgi:hypothetical protein
MALCMLLYVVMGFAASGPALAAGDSNTAVCPNEALTGFRPYLADCRAYEMVSPPYKAGQSVGPQDSAATDGKAVAFLSDGVFAEAPASIQGFNGYLTTRNNGGWSTVSIDPNTVISPGFNVSAEPEDVSADLSKSLVLYVSTANQGQAGNSSSAVFYLREGDGTQVKASPTFTSSTGETMFQHVSYVGGAADLSTLLFGSTTPLISSDTEPPGYRRLYDVSGAGGPSPTLGLVGVTTGGAVIDKYCDVQLGSSNLGSAYHAISQHGDRIFFYDNVNEVEGESGKPCDEAAKPEALNFANPAELFVRIDGSRTYEVSKPLAATECTAVRPTKCAIAERRTATFEGANEEGSKVFFMTKQSLVVSDKDKFRDLYMAEIGSAGVSRLVLVSEGDATDSTIGKNAKVLGVTRVSSDGSHVYFVATGQLTTHPNPTTGQSAIVGANNLYGFDTVTGELHFVAILPGSDQSLWGIEDVRPAQTTPDGRFLVFDSFGQLVTTGPEADTDTASDVYEYDFETGALRRITVGVAGYDDNGNNSLFDASISLSYFGNAQVRVQYGMATRAVTDNGSTVVFTTAEPLSPLAVNGQANVYEWHEGDVSLVSTGHSPTADSSPVITPLGGDIFFNTSDGVLPQDGDGVLDIYDARVNGGFAFAPIPPGPCAGEACRGPLSASPGLSLPGSATTASGENLSPSPARAVVKKAKAKAKKKKKKAKKRRKATRSRGHAFAGSAHTTLRGKAR